MQALSLEEPQILTSTEALSISATLQSYAFPHNVVQLIFDCIAPVKETVKGIKGNQIRDLHYLTQIPNLQTVTLDWCTESDIDIGSLTQCTRIKNLTLMYLSHLSDDHISTIAQRLPCLHTVSLYECRMLTNKAIVNLYHSNSLQVLQIDHLMIEKLLDITAVRNTNLSDYEDFIDNATKAEKIRSYIDYSAVLQNIAAIPNLQTLQIVGHMEKDKLALIENQLPPKIKNNIPNNIEVQLIPVETFYQTSI